MDVSNSIFHSFFSFHAELYIYVIEAKLVFRSCNEIQKFIETHLSCSFLNHIFMCMLYLTISEYYSESNQRRINIDIHKELSEELQPSIV